MWLGLGKIKILHLQKHAISYGYKLLKIFKTDNEAFSLCDVKGVLNPNFWPFSFELNKKKIF